MRLEAWTRSSQGWPSITRFLRGAIASTSLAAPLLLAVSAAPDTGEKASADASADATPEVPLRSADPGVEEITVTARKRSERLQDTPIAVSAFNTEALRDLEIRNIADVQKQVPNLQFDNAVGSASSARIYIRGVGNSDFTTRDDPGVGVYVDGVYLARAQGTLLAVSDIAQVEVLRGPQGTLFGRNTIGGAVSITTKKPSFEFGGVAEVRGGTNGLFETRAAVDIPLIPEMAAMRVSLATETDNGNVHNRFTGSRVADNKLLAGRMQLLVTPTETSEIQIAIDHSRENRSALAAKCKVIPSSDPGNEGLLQSPIFRFLAPEVQTGCELDDQITDDEINVDGPLEDRLRTYGASLTGTVDLTDDISIKSISAWRRQKIAFGNDLDGTIFNIAQTQREFGLNKTKQDQISQEFNLTGTSLDGKLKWTTGVYGFYETTQTNSSSRTFAFADGGRAFRPEDVARDPFLGLVSALTPGAPGRVIPLSASETPTFNGVGDCVPDPSGQIAGTLAAVGLAGSCLRAFGSVPEVGFLKTSVTSYAAYGEFTYDVTNALSLTAGLRYTHDRKRVSEQEMAIGDEGPLGVGRINVPAVGGPRFLSNYELSKRFSKLTPRATLQYRFSEDINAYATVSRGFKSGGFSSDDAPNLPREYDPEVLTSYEFGVKSSFFDNRLIANFASYINYYEDIQLTVLLADTDGTLLSTTLNAGEARILGTELELTAIPLDGLRLAASLGVAKSRYTKFDMGDSNARLPGTPALTMSYTAAYTLPLGDVGDLRTTFTWNHQGKKASDVGDSRATRVNKRGLLSGRMSLELADGVTEVSIFGSNLLDRDYFPIGIDLSESLGTVRRNYAPGRQLGIELRRRF